jgi:hypothetical protein
MSSVQRLSAYHGTNNFFKTPPHEFWDEQIHQKYACTPWTIPQSAWLLTGSAVLAGSMR